MRTGSGLDLLIFDRKLTVAPRLVGLILAYEAAQHRQTMQDAERIVAGNPHARWSKRGVESPTDQMVAVVPYSSEVQQPVRATAVLDGYPHMRWAAQRDREQGRASSLQPGGQPKAAAEPSNQVSNDARRQ